MSLKFLRPWFHYCKEPKLRKVLYKLSIYKVFPISILQQAPHPPIPGCNFLVIYVLYKVYIGAAELRIETRFHKVLTYIEYRAVSGVFRTTDPPPPLHPASVSSPRTKGGGYTIAGRWRGGGLIFRKTSDIGLASYSRIPLRPLRKPRIKGRPRKKVWSRWDVAHWKMSYYRVDRKLWITTGNHSRYKTEGKKCDNLIPIKLS